MLAVKMSLLWAMVKELFERNDGLEDTEDKISSKFRCNELGSNGKL